MDDFLSDYLHYAVEGNEVPEIYHKWAGMAALSMCAGRRFWLKATPEYILYPNLYILLVGGAGGRKSSAMNVAKGIVRDVGGIEICATQITKEALAKEMTQEDFLGRKSFVDPDTQRMVEYTEYAVFANEWVHFIAVNPTGMTDFLTEVWDQHVYDAKTKNMGNDLIIGPCIPLLGCMTPSTTTAQLKADIINGGFARRCIFVYSTRGRKAVPFPSKTTDQLAARERVINRGKKISQSTSFCGAFSWNDDALHWYVDWYRSHFASLHEKTDPWTEGYYQSKHDLLLKVALLCEVSGGSDRLLSIKSLEKADALLAETEVHLPKIFEGAGRNELSTVANQILELLRNQESISRKQLLRDLYGQASSAELSSVIEHLTTTDQIVAVQKGDDGPVRYMTKEKYDARTH